MIRLSRMADYGFVLLSCMSRGRGGDNGSADPPVVHTASELSEQAGLPEPVVGKILKQLTKAGLLVSRRGARGGYFLAKAPERITATDVICALEGPLALTHCSETRTDLCQREEECQMGGHWQRISRTINDTLASVTLADLASANPPVPHTWSEAEARGNR